MCSAIVALSLLAAIGISLFSGATPTPWTLSARPKTSYMPGIVANNSYGTASGPIISYLNQVFSPNGTLLYSSYIYNKTIVNTGLNQLAALIGDAGAAITLYMVSSTATSVNSGDSSCPSALTTNGFTVYSTTANYVYAGGSATTFTTFGTWTYTGSSNVVVTDMCLTTSSTNAANGLLDETLVNPTAGYTLQTNYVFKETVTVTV